MKKLSEDSYTLPDGYTVESATYGPDYTFGSVDGREFAFDVRTPCSMQVWRDGGFRFSWRRLLNPVRWWRAMATRANWQFSWRRWRNTNHRCYCPTGSSCDGRIVLCGFGIQWWYSRYDGEVPCDCDRIIEELEQQDD